jgi:hypothetical protein
MTTIVFEPIVVIMFVTLAGNLKKIRVIYFFVK